MRIREFKAVDDHFFLVSAGDGRLLAKTWTLQDAQLIAAAPDMFEALQSALSQLDGAKVGSGSYVAARIIRAALAKVKGAL
jgi:hypothetical protein